VREASQERIAAIDDAVSVQLGRSEQRGEGREYAPVAGAGKTLQEVHARIS
jgi:hypothetical protein